MERFWQAAGLRADRRAVLARPMRLTKLEHAAVVLEDSGDKLYIDPGKFTTPITESAGAVAVVITHEHDDHWTPEQLKRIRDANPGVRIFGPAGVAAADGSDVDSRIFSGFRSVMEAGRGWWWWWWGGWG